jgi:hypothetical protein
MIKMYAIALLAAALVLGGASAPAAAVAEPGTAVIVTPSNGSVYDTSFDGPVVVDLSAAGATDPSQQFVVTYGNNTGYQRTAATLSGNAAHNEVPIEQLEPDSWWVRVDPTWLGDAYTVQSNFRVDAVGWAYFSPNWDGQFPQSQVSLDAVLNSIPAGTPVHWRVGKNEPCSGSGCDPDVSGVITANGSYNQRVTLPLNGLSGGEYTADLESRNPYYEWASTYFTIIPGPKVTDLSASPDAFYPLVRDGYRDRATVGFRLSKNTEVALRVQRDGRTVRSQRWGSLAAGRHTWTWNGRRNNGEKTLPGRYKVLLTATDEFGNTDTASRMVEVATDVVTRRGIIERRGPDTSSRSRSGNCRFYTILRELSLDCWGGRHATAVYNYRVPRKAFDLRRFIYGEYGCCDRGRVTVSGTRTGPATYATTVRVTNWRSYTVEWADLHYKYKVRR